MKTFFEMGGFSMIIVLICGAAALIIALYATGRPSQPHIRLARHLAAAEIAFSVAGYASNVATTLFAVGELGPEADGDRTRMLLTGLYESTAPIIMGLTFVALTHVALGVAGFRLARREP